MKISTLNSPVAYIYINKFQLSTLYIYSYTHFQKLRSTHFPQILLNLRNFNFHPYSGLHPIYISLLSTNISKLYNIFHISKHFQTMDRYYFSLFLKHPVYTFSWRIAIHSSTRSNAFAIHPLQTNQSAPATHEYSTTKDYPPPVSKKGTKKKK